MNNSTQNINSNGSFWLNSTVNLTITKTVSTPPGVTVGSNVTYIITVTNHGPDYATGVVVRDVLDNRLAFVSTNNSNATNSSQTVTWNINNLGVGQTVILNITVRVVGTGTINNTATVNVTQINVGNNNTNVSFSLGVTVNLTILKTVNVPVGVTVVSNVTYTITVTNHGPDNATGVRITDVLDSKLIFVNTNNTNATNSSQTVTWNIGNLGIGQTVILTITVRVNGTGTINNLATVNVTEPNVGMNGSGDNFNSSANFTLPSTVNLSIVKTVNVPVGVTVGSNVTYTITVTNHGPDVATGVNVTDVR
jgi:uncharacterized repeat protein (TIGR01451 family)